MKKELGILLFAGTSMVSLHGYEFHPVGFESIGMGGAGVSNARGSMAGYYNPALLAKPKYTFEISSGFGLGIKEDNLATQVDKLADVDLSETIDRVTKTTAAFDGLVLNQYDDTDKQNLKTAVDVLKSVYVQNYLTIMPTSSLSLQYENFHLGSYSTTTASANIIVDPNSLELYSPYGNSYIHYDPYADGNPYSTITLTQEQYESTSLEYAIDNKKTYIALSGVSLVEVPLSYATSYEIFQGDLSIGGSVKYMGAGIYSDKVDVDTKADDLADRFDDKVETSSNFGIDLGFIYQPIEEISIGLVGKNLNSPEFDSIDPNNPLTIEPMFRGGLTFSFWDSLDISMDYDLTENETALNYQKSQYFGGGINFKPASWVSLRAGVMNNVAYKESPYIYTAGFGLGIQWLQFDFSAQIADEFTMVDGQEITNYVKVNFALVSKWGKKAKKEVPILRDENRMIESSRSREDIQRDANKAFDELNKEVQNEN